MLTYEEAVERVLESDVAAEWRDRHGVEPYADPEGYQDARDYLVPLGDREQMMAGIADNDDAPAVLVDKTTGAVRTVEVLEHQDKIDAMDPV